VAAEPWFPAGAAMDNLHQPSPRGSDTERDASPNGAGAPGATRWPVLSLDGDQLTAHLGTEPGTRTLAAALHARRRRGGGPGAPGRAQRGDGLLTADELRGIEDTYADGITAVQIVDAFVSRGVRFSEASFRKYVQQGLLPRSRRVGRKGKNKGSMGVYPAKTVRRINEIKRLMAQGYTIEEIAAQFLQFTDLVENVEEAVAELVERIDQGVASPGLDAQARRGLARDLAEARRLAGALVERLRALTERVAAPKAEELRKSGAAGSAEDLL